MEANEKKDQSFKKSEDISVDNDSFDSVGAENEDLDQVTKIRLIRPI
jgi:hypothetical protein